MSSVISKVDILYLREMVNNDICAGNECTGMPAKGAKWCAKCRPTKKNASRLFFRRK